MELSLLWSLEKNPHGRRSSRKPLRRPRPRELRSLCLTKSSACGRLWQFAQPRPLSLLQRGLAPRSKGKAEVTSQQRGHCGLHTPAERASPPEPVVKMVSYLLACSCVILGKSLHSLPTLPGSPRYHHRDAHAVRCLLPLPAQQAQKAGLRGLLPSSSERPTPQAEASGRLDRDTHSNGLSCLCPTLHQAREVPCSALKGETVPDSLPATPKRPPTRRVPPRGGKD